MLVRGGGIAAVAIAGGGIVEALGGAKPLPRIPSFAVTPMAGRTPFHSRRDLHPPLVTTSERLGRTDPGLLFLGPGPVSLKGSHQYGPLIVDRHGELAWFRPLAPGSR
jgi:hypothetical protein